MHIFLLNSSVILVFWTRLYLYGLFCELANQEF